MDKFLPMCAANGSSPKAFAKLRWPMIGSPKLDGIRCVVHPTLGPVSRHMKPIANRHVRAMLNQPDLIGLDGELVVGPPNAGNVFSATQSGIMSHGGEPDFTFHVFDTFDSSAAYDMRLRLAAAQVADAAMPRVQLLSHAVLHTTDELDEYEAQCVGDGYEGVMLRSPDCDYQYRYSDLRSQGLVKLKRMQDDEARIVSYEPLTRITGEVSHDMVGKLHVVVTTGPYAGATLRVGSGLTHDNRYDMVARWHDYVGKHITFKYQAVGSVNRPRLPVFKGMRPESDAQ